MRGALTDKVLAGPYTREPTSIDRFYRSGAYKQYEHLALGTYTASDVIQHHKLIDAPRYPVTDYELARAYLGELWAENAPRGKKRIPFDAGAWPYLELNPPAYFARARAGDLAYVDIKSCYFQLYAPLTLDLEYSGHAGATRFGLGKVPFLAPEWLQGEKLIRNGIVGIARNTTRREWQAGAFREVQSHNKFLAPQLWGYLMHTLHAIAREASGVIPIYYWNTDGAITDAEAAPRLVDYLAEEWALVADVRASGEGHVHGFGSYAVGDVHTALRQGSRPIDQVLELDPVHVSRLKRWRKWALQHYG